MASPRTGPKAAGSATTKFFGSQIGGGSVINYSYTDMPWRLIGWDITTFFQYSWALPYIIFPLRPTDSGDLCELSFTRGNVFCISLHVILCVVQLLLLLSIPFLLLLPVWMVALGITVSLTANNIFCGLLNGNSIEYWSEEQYAPALPEHSHEQWIFVNGVAVGKTWMMSNLNRLALTFKRPVLGIHNKTSGILLDVLECLIQRNLGYATEDVRVCYKQVKEKLYDPKLSKVVLILHSQGGIIGSLVIDWLLQELPGDTMAKLEVYTFGNAANHFNNPHRHIHGQNLALGHPLAASVDATNVTKVHPMHHHPPTPISPGPSSTTPDNTTHPDSRPSELSLGTSETSSFAPAAASDRVIAHIEHFAHEMDFVSLWGVLHFATSAMEKHSMPRFIGRVFATSLQHKGHQFCQHYLDLAFPLVRDPKTGKFTGCADTGEFMESEITIGSAGDESSDLREAMETSWIGWAFDDEDKADGEKREAEVTMHGASPVEERGRWRSRAYGSSNKQHGATRTYKVKELSRLWLYRNGRSPKERPPLLVKGADGVTRNATM